MNAQEIIEEIGAQRGWTPATMLAVVCQYIDNQGSDGAFLDFLGERADSESGLMLKMLSPSLIRIPLTIKKSTPACRYEKMT